MEGERTVPFAMTSPVSLKSAQRPRLLRARKSSMRPAVAHLLELLIHLSVVLVVLYELQNDTRRTSSRTAQRSVDGHRLESTWGPLGDKKTHYLLCAPLS